VALVNTRPVLPATVTTGNSRYPLLEEILGPLRVLAKRVIPIDADALAVKAGTAQAMNVVMLGALSGFIPLAEDQLLKALEEVVPPKYLDANKLAFALGKAEVE
jgi:indolepyruvate ferredoxin oxidoreductase beta subunit